MKLTVFLILISVGCALASKSYSQTTLLSLEMNNSTIKEILDEIEGQSEFRFMYSGKFVDVNREVSLDVKNRNVEAILDILFSDTEVDYTVKDRFIVLVTPELMYEGTLAVMQQRSVSGRVTDSGGQPLPGVSVVVKGTTHGTVTNNDGEYSINNIPEDALLVFSFVGMRSQEIEVRDQTSININMEEEAIGIEEVVAIGYGTMKKSDITGSVSSVKTAALEENPVTNISTVLRGRVAGLNVTSSGNKPGSTPSIRLRGNRSISASNDPLFVIDGIPVSGNINDFNIQDIASIEILKDASATAIYGARGANGVIIVTTKQGKSGVTTITYDGYLSVSEAFRKIPMMNGPRFTEYKREAYRASGRYTDDFAIFDPIELEMIESGEWTDWQDLLLQTGLAHNHSLSINGGSDNTTFNISLNYLNDEGIIPLQDFTRYNTRINFNHSFKKIRFGTSIIGTYSITNGADENPYSYATQLIPLSRPYDDDGNLLLMTTAEASTYNPLTVIVPEQNVNRNKRYRIFGNVYGEIDISNSLKYRLNFGPDISQNRTGNYRGSYTPQRREGASTANLNERFQMNYTLENILYYNNLFKEKHRLNFTGLYSIQSQLTESSGIDVLGVPIDAMQYHNIGSSESIEGLRSDFVKWSILSGMVRLNYVFNEKYLVTFTSRMDGSSRFGKNQKWGFFPSAAIGWNIHNEDFMAGSELFDNLRLRVSYGSAGNTAISPYQTMGRLSRTDYDFGGNPAFGFRPSSIRNDDLRWEKTTSYNIGIDFSIINNRLSGNVEYYSQNTSDLLLQRQLPPTSGFSSVIENIGKTQNNGLEAAVSAIVIPKKSTKSFDWTVDFNISTNKEKIVELYGGKIDDIGNQWFIGHPINVFFDYEKIGIWQKGEESLAESYGTKVGQIKLKDQDSDGFIDANDRVILGARTPKLNGGITNRFTYNNFDLTVFLYGAGGHMINSTIHTSRNTLFGRYNNLDVDYWTEDNPTNKYPQPFSDQERPLYHTTMAYFDGWYIKCGNITLGYNFPSSFLNKFNSKSLRLYLTLQNPFIISPYVNDGEGIDPEFPTLSTPNTKSYLLGLNVSF